MKTETRSSQPEPLASAVREKLGLVLDPELGISITELGLVYGIHVNDEGVARITMTLTTLGCPLFDQIQSEIEERVMELPEIEEVEIELTFDPPWSPEKMAPEARIKLGLD